MGLWRMRNAAVEAPLLGPVHFVGIGGSGMAGLAELALARGLKVQGSDAKDSPVLARLRELGANVRTGHGDGRELGDAKTVVLSSAIPRDNAERKTAEERGLTILHRSEFLAALMLGTRPITIAGTHGKSTTTAMIAHVLEDLGCDPTVSLGGTMLRYGSAAKAGKSDLFIAEADESDGSFLNYRPYVGVITNVAPDHMDFYKDEAALIRSFERYLAQIDEEGTAVIGWDNPMSREIGSRYEKNRLTYGFLIGSEVRAIDYKLSKGEVSFSAIVERDRVPVRLRAFGRHNAQNALCALAVCRVLELDVKKAAASLEGFTGVDRRMTLVHEQPGVVVYDDYAHNPGKISACIVSLKEAWPDRKLHVVYQAHRFSRLETMYDDMLKAVSGADLVHVVPVYSAGESTTRDFSPEKLARDMEPRAGVKALPCSSLDAAVRSVVTRLDKPAVVLTVGAGDVWTVARDLKDALI